jgi:hypothetical protein
MRRILLLLLIITFCIESSFSQLESSAFSATGRGGVATTFVTDYQTIGINPANLGFVKSFREFSSTITAEPLTRDELFNSFFKTETTNLTFAEKEQAVARFADKSIGVNIDAMLFGFSIHLPRNIGVAVSVRDRVQLYTRLGRGASELAFLGANSSYFPNLLLSDGSQVFNPRNPTVSAAYEDVIGTPLPSLSEEEQSAVVLGFFDEQRLNDELGITDLESFSSKDLLSNSRISASWFREYNISIGGRIYDSYNLSVYAGVGYREIRGLLVVDLEISEGSDSTIFDQNYLSVATGLIDFDQFQVRDGATFKDFLFPSGVAKGRGFDFGATFVIKRNLYIAASVTNVGQITSGDSTYSVGGQNLIEQFGGFGLSNYNLIGSQENGFAIGGDNSPIDWTPQPIRKVDLPSNFRFGASYEYLRTLHIGFDVVIPLNDVAGNLEEPLYAIGGDFRFSKIFKLSSGVNIGGNNGGKINIPLGITYIAKKGFYEAGIATRDFATYLSNSEGSTLSFASGFLRFKLGTIKQ